MNEETNGELIKSPLTKEDIERREAFTEAEIKEIVKALGSSYMVFAFKEEKVGGSLGMEVRFASGNVGLHKSMVAIESIMEYIKTNT